MAAQVEVTPAGCWRWTGLTSPQGYARVMHLRARTPGHRLAYELLVGPVLDGLVLHHVCHVEDRNCPGGRTCLHRACLRPAHLVPMTQAEHAAIPSNRSRTAMKKAA